MTNKKFSYVFVGIFLTMNGCASAFDFMVPKHSLSDTKTPELVCVQFKEVKQEALLATAGAVVIPILVGYAVDQVSKGLEEESKRYSASYSGRASTYLLKVSKPSAEVPMDVDIVPSDIFLDRYVGPTASMQGCPGNQKKVTPDQVQKMEEERVVHFAARITASGTGTIKLTPTDIRLNKTKAKVSWWSSEVDLNAQITLSTFVASKEGELKQVVLTQTDFPIGKHGMPEAATPLHLDEVALKHLEKDNIVLPDFQLDPAKLNLPGPDAVYAVPLDLTITFMESDDFGDVIGKGAKQLAANKTKISDAVLDALGLKEQKPK